jgi:putative transposase
MRALVRGVSADLRHLEQMMAERGIDVDHSTVYRWAIKVLPVIEKARSAATSEPLAEAGGWTNIHLGPGPMEYLYRTVDKERNTVDFLLRARRNEAAAQRYFEKSSNRNGPPETVTIDGSGANLAALEAINARLKTPIKGSPDEVSQQHR